MPLVTVENAPVEDGRPARQAMIWARRAEDARHMHPHGPDVYIMWKR